MVFCNAVAIAQRDSSFILVKDYKGDIADAVLDNLDNLYIISSQGQIKKFNANSDSVAIYNQVRKYGQLTAIDVSNPLKPLLFYKDFSTVVILDRLLANRLTLDLRKFSILQPGAIGLSYDNNIWVFDEYDSKLKKIDEQGNLLLETPDFRSIFGKSITPQKIINDNGFVYLADTAQGVYVFDNYGAYKKKFDVKRWGSIDVINGTIIRTSKDEIIVYNPATYSDVTKKIPSFFQPYIHSFTVSNKLVTFNNTGLRIYRFRF
jgi:hypothetical protein